MTKPQFGLALGYVSDMATAKRFYVEVLGLTVERDHPAFVQFHEPAGARFALATDESMDGSRNVELYWLVDNAEAAYREMSPKAEVSLPLKQMPFGKVFGIKDPSGQPRYVLELAADRPSQEVS